MEPSVWLRHRRFQQVMHVSKWQMTLTTAVWIEGQHWPGRISVCAECIYIYSSTLGMPSKSTYRRIIAGSAWQCQDHWFSSRQLCYAFPVLFHFRGIFYHHSFWNPSKFIFLDRNVETLLKDLNFFFLKQMVQSRAFQAEVFYWQKSPSGICQNCSILRGIFKET